MKLAIMQPYFFPYIGYWQLINAVDTFVIYDDINYIKQGWVNRNRIIINNQVHFITLELLGAGSFKKINEIRIGKNKNKILKTIEQSYKRAPYFHERFKLVHEMFSIEENNLAKFLTTGLNNINHYLGIKTHILISSEIEKNNDLRGANKVIHLCNLLNATKYINAIGGKELYSKESFSQQGIELRFLKTNNINYKQFTKVFVPCLSIIDVLMFNSVEEIRTMINHYELV